MSGERIQRLGEAWGGLHSQRGSGAGNGRRSKSNIKHKKRLTSLSVNVQERSTRFLTCHHHLLPWESPPTALLNA
jgi:hypothetical protein